MEKNLTKQVTTLHQLTLAPKYWHSTIEQISKIWHADDVLLLMGEAAQGYSDSSLDCFSSISIVENDAALLPQPHQTSIKIINYSEWAELVLNSQRAITWR